MMSGLMGWIGISDSAPAQTTTRPHISSMSSTVACALSTPTIRYNVKIVIRGARGTGKTSLLQRLQGLPIYPTYSPSGSISAATINYRGRKQKSELSDVKIEVWDVVDNGFAQHFASSTEGKIEGAPAHMPAMPTDASTVDVYTLCTSAIFVFDITRRETFDYVVTESRKVPLTVLIAICANFSDREAERVVSRAEVENLCRTLRRTGSLFITNLCRGIPENALSFPAVAIETCVVSDYGLRPLHSYFALPVAYAKIVENEKKLILQYEEAQLELEELEEIQERHRAPAAGAATALMATLINRKGVMQPEETSVEGRGPSRIHASGTVGASGTVVSNFLPEMDDGSHSTMNAFFSGCELTDDTSPTPDAGDKEEGDENTRHVVGKVVNERVSAASTLASLRVDAATLSEVQRVASEIEATLHERSSKHHKRKLRTDDS